MELEHYMAVRESLEHLDEDMVQLVGGYRMWTKVSATFCLLKACMQGVGAYSVVGQCGSVSAWRTFVAYLAIADTNDNPCQYMGKCFGC